MTDLQIVTGSNPDPIAAFAAAELARYAGDLFGVAAAINTRPAAATASVWLDAGGSGLAVPDDPQSYTLRRFTQPAGGDHLLAAGGSPAATLWAVYELVRGWGVQFLLSGDLLPDAPGPLRLPADDRTCTPNLDTRCWRLINDFVCGPESWGLAENRRFIDQLAKNAFNEVPAVAVAVAVVRALRVPRRGQAHRLLLVRLPLPGGRAHRGPRAVRRGGRIREPRPGRDRRLPRTARRRPPPRHGDRRARIRPRHREQHVAVAAGVSPGVSAGHSGGAGGAPARREDLRPRQRPGSRRPVARRPGAHQDIRPPAHLSRRRAPVPWAFPSTASGWIAPRTHGAAWTTSTPSRRF